MDKPATLERELCDIAAYVCGYEVADPRSFEAARVRLIDLLACAFEALLHPDCTRLLGPEVS